MNLRRPLTLVLAISMLMPVVPLQAGPHEHTPLEDQMEIIGKAFRSLRREVRDPAKNESAAELVAKMLQAASKSTEYEPKWTADQPADEQAAFVAGYRKEMKKFVAMLEELHAALKAGDNDRANELVADLRSQQRSSHREYKKPDDDD